MAAMQGLGSGVANPGGSGRYSHITDLAAPPSLTLDAAVAHGTKKPPAAAAAAQKASALSRKKGQAQRLKYGKG